MNRHKENKTNKQKITCCRTISGRAGQPTFKKKKSISILTEAEVRLRVTSAVTYRSL